MKFPRKKSKNYFYLFVLLISLLLGVSCNDPNTNQNVSNNSATPEKINAPKDNVEELSNLIKLPETPQEAVWREDEAENQKGKKLIAVLKYNGESADKLVALVEKNNPAAQEVQIGAEEWFPEELTAQTQLSGNESLKGISYGANDFFNPPYKNGRIIKIQDTNYFILELTAF